MVLTTDALGFSTCAARVAGTGVRAVVFPPPTWLMSTMTMRTIATTATLEMVTTVGDCQGGRRSRVTDRAATWLRRCFLLTGLAPALPVGTGCLPIGLRGVSCATASEYRTNLSRGCPGA